MKALTSLILMMLPSVCFSQADTDKEIVETFIDRLTKSDSSNIKELLELMTINDSLININDGSMIKFFVYAWKDEIGKYCDSKYDVTPHRILDRQLLDHYKLQYDNLENVYYLVCQNQVLTHIIVKDGKVISFSAGIRKGENQPVFPIMLN